MSRRVPRDTPGMTFSPRVHELLLARVWEHDDGRLTMAEIWRRLRRDAARLGLFCPGYHTIRTIVKAERERRAAQREALVIAVEEAFAWSPDVFRILDHLAAAARRHRFRPPARINELGYSVRFAFDDSRPP
jgi:hypothetical protein